MILISVIFLSLLSVGRSATLPCPSNCEACSSGTQCTSCASQYYALVVGSTTTCPSCSDYCLQCNSNTQCIQCLDPYVLGSDKACYECVIENAVTCSSTVSASTCVQQYYPSDNYCYSCLLNCAQCTSGFDCASCVSSYYLNATVLTCNPCPTHCTSCNQFLPDICTACADGYLLTGTTCTAVTCTVSNCVHCSSTNICAQCNPWYLWNGSSCIEGASVMCESGAEGYFPNQCNNQCSDYGYAASTTGTAIHCLPYVNVDVGDASYKQYYYYAYNNQEELRSLFSTANSIALESNSEYSYLISNGDTLSMATLPSYYQILFTIKYTSSVDITLALSATTEDFTQTESLSLATKTSVGVVQINTVALHSNNMQMQIGAGDVKLYQLLIRVKKCPSNCFRCLNEELCEMCNSPQYVSNYVCVDNCTVYYHLSTNRSCLTSCPDAYYHENLGTNQKFCQACVSPCVNCLSASQCLSCISGRYLYNYTCVTTCPDGYFTGTSQCEVCISPCKLCTSETACLSCDEGYWDGSQCTNECPSGQYGDNSTHECVNCQYPCLTCRNTSTICLSCQGSTLYYHEYSCISTCPDRYYPETNLTCSICQLPCLTCTSSSSCLTCSYNYLYQNQCLANCPDAFYENITARECSSCLAACSKCDSGDSCTGCVSGYLHLGGCVTSCPYGQYYGSCSGGSCECLECAYPCDLCTSLTQCLSCIEGYLYLSECVSNCPDGYYGNTTSFTCDLCSSTFSNCLECDQSQCSHCDNNLTLHEGQCVSTCPTYYYKQSTKCQKCIAPCSTCSSFTSCLSCIDPYILNGDSCSIQCPFNQVAITQNGTTACYSCVSPCLSCAVTTTACTLCSYGYYLMNSTCLTNCSALTPTFTYYDEPITSTCNQCLFPCLTCTSQTACLSCRVGYLTGTSCQQCAYGTYADQTTGRCLNCPTECTNCFTSTYCTSCADGYFLYQSQCISNSSICEANGYYVSGKTCSPCQSPCSKCTGASTNCTQCLSGYIYYQDDCLTECPTGTYRSNNACLSCHSYCASCSTTDTYCFSCKTSYYLYLANMSCLEGCPDGSYVEGSICQSCRYPCEFCSSETACLSCISGTLVGTECFTSCPSGQFVNASMQCQNCTSPCKECENETTNCTQCQTNYYLFQSTCLSACPSLYFPQTEAQQCMACLGLCKDCNSHINCTSCYNDTIYYYDSGTNYAQCVSTCPTSFYNTTSTSITSDYECAACLSACSTCANNLQCLLCNNNKVQYNGACFDECPAQMYPYEGVCQDCTSPCFNCTDTFTCTACMNDSFLLVGSAECIVGDLCPSGFYLITGTRNCNGQCPTGEYHRNDRTCSSIGCADNEYMGADWFCYETCPTNFLANKTFHCNSCSGDECKQGLFFQVSSSIKNDQLYMYLIFTEEPVYIGDVSISITPTLPFQRLSRRMLATVSSTRNITLQLTPSSSISQQYLQVSFLNPLQTFSNPIQDPSVSYYLEGFDIYPDLPTFTILGIFALACSLIGLVKNPYMTDFGQSIFLMGLLTIHYPLHLASAVESTGLAHFNSLVPIEQLHAQGQHKFSYVTNMGFLSNCTFNLILMGVCFLVALILLAIYEGLKKTIKYNRVEDESDEAESPEAPSETKVKMIKKLEVFFSNYKVQYLNRFVYFNYLPLILFTFAQYHVINFTYGPDTAASLLAILIIIPLLIYPFYIYQDKPKYAFLCLRKIVLALALVLSINYATYMIGVCAVVSLTSAVLVVAYKLQKWRVQTRFIMVGQILQFLLYVCLAIFAMLGEGNFTEAKVYLGWFLIFWMLLISLVYISFSIFELVLWSCRVCGKVDYKERWKRDEAKSEYGKDSESNDDDMKEAESKKDEKQPLSGKTIKIEKLFAQLDKEGVKDEVNSSNNNQLFWTYNDNEDEDDKTVQDDKSKPPEMLIRCVNEFSELDESENNK